MVLLFLGALYVGLCHVGGRCAHILLVPPPTTLTGLPATPGVPMPALGQPYAYPLIGFDVLYIFWLG